MIDKIGISPQLGMTSICRGCGEKVGRIKVRGIQKSFSYTNYFCFKCTKEQLLGANEKIKNLKKEFIKLSRFNKKERKMHLRKLKMLNNLK